jgi:hypothetical protein
MMRAQQALPQYERPPRRNCRLTALLSFGDVNNRLRSSIENMSATGAAVILDENASAERLRDGMLRSRGRVLLVLPHERTCVEADIVWQRDGRVGLRFRETFQPYRGRL